MLSRDYDRDAALIQKVKALEAKTEILEEENRTLRYLLAVGHDSVSHRIYGDDGELQCPVCHIDFVRDPAKDIKRKLEESGMRELRQAIFDGLWPPKNSGGKV